MLLSRRLVWWLLTVLWAVQIFRFSTETFGSDPSRSLIATLLTRLRLQVPPDTLLLLNTTVRKSAHLAEYAILACLLYRAVHKQERLSWKLSQASLAVLLASLYALTDELHQAFVPGRSAAATDWAIDAAGAGLGMLVLHACLRRRPTRIPRSPSYGDGTSALA